MVLRSFTVDTYMNRIIRFIMDTNHLSSQNLPSFSRNYNMKIYLYNGKVVLWNAHWWCKDCGMYNVSMYNVSMYKSLNNCFHFGEVENNYCVYHYVSRLYRLENNSCINFIWTVLWALHCNRSFTMHHGKLFMCIFLCEQFYRFHIALDPSNCTMGNYSCIYLYMNSLKGFTLHYCLIWFFTSHQQSSSYIGTGIPGLDQY